jgi:parallel beta-helix repeat protein
MLEQLGPARLVVLLGLLGLTAAFAVKVEPGAVLEITADTTLDPARTYGRIAIKASNITLDGRGASVIGSSKGNPRTFTGAGISSKGTSGVTVKNIKARGWETGLVVEDGEKWTVENCDFSGNFHDPSFGWGENGRRGGIVLERVRQTTLRKCRANQVWDGCVLVGCNDNTIEDCDFSRTSNTCLKLWNSSRNRIRANKLDHGIRIKPGEVHARDSTCVLIESGSNDNRFSNNSCTHGGDGIFIRVLNGWVSTGNIFEKNDCSFANNNCFEAWSPRNTYLHNKANHGSYGFWLGASDQTVLIGNEASHNGDPKGNHNSPHLPDNGHAGIVFMFGPSSHTIMRGNTCVGNNGAGIALIGDLGSKGKKWRAFHWIIEENTLKDNTWGIYAQHADWVDLARNVLAGNRKKDVFTDNVTNLTRHDDEPKITKPPRADLKGPSKARVGEKVGLDASASSDPGMNRLRFRWDLGDGTISDRPRLEHTFAAPGFYRVGLTVNNGLFSDLAWRDFYVVPDREETGTEGRARDWTWIDPGSKAKFSDDAEVKIAGRSSLAARIDPYSGGRVNLLYPASRKADLSLKGKTRLVFWVKFINENIPAWQGPNPIVTLHETEEKFLRFTPEQEILLDPALPEAREGWMRVVVPLAGDAVWKREGKEVAAVRYLTIGFDSWGYAPLQIWLDGLGLE